MLAGHDLPVRVCNLSSIWMVHYTEPSRYNWMFQYYLRAERLALSWVGTGRLIFSLNYTDADFAEVAKRFVDAARENEAGRLVVARRFPHQQEHPPADPEGDVDANDFALAHVSSTVASSFETRRRRSLPQDAGFLTLMARSAACRASRTMRPWMCDRGITWSSAQACLTCFSRPGSISSPFSRYSGDL